MKRFLITLGLLVIFVTSLITFIALYISGPSLKYDIERKEEMMEIQQNSQEKYLDFHRHVFRYVTYVGESEDRYDWFNRDGELLLYKLKTDVKMEDAIRMVMQEHDLEDLQGSIGYGYDNGAYIIENDEYVAVLDIDTMKELSYQRK